jgi:hypothetical protein
VRILIDHGVLDAYLDDQKRLKGELPEIYMGEDES